MEPIYKKSTVDLAVEKLIEYIQDESVLIDQKLPAETALSRELNISRTTIREAYRVLQSQGYIEIKSDKGAFVKSKERDFIREAAEWISLHRVQISDYLFARLALDPMVARLAAENATKKDVEALGSIHVQFLQAVHGGDHEMMTSLDGAFHEAIAKITGNDLMISLIRMTNCYFEHLRRNSFRFEEHAAHAVEPHERIFKAIASRQPKEAAEASFDHMIQGFEDLCGWKPDL